MIKSAEKGGVIKGAADGIDNIDKGAGVITQSVFYVVAFADALVMDMLNIMRFAANPAAKRAAHITLRGPYRGRLPKAVVHQLSQITEGAAVGIQGAGVFFDKGQNTVYLHCHSPAIRAAWHKPHLPYTPHLTIYDGKSRALAKAIYQTLADANINQTRPATAIAGMLSPTTTPELRPSISPKALSQITGIKTLDELADANNQTRLQTIKKTATLLATL